MRGRVRSYCDLCGSEEVCFLTLEPDGNLVEKAEARTLRVDSYCTECAKQPAGLGVMLIRVEHILLR